MINSKSLTFVRSKAKIAQSYLFRAQVGLTFGWAFSRVAVVVAFGFLIAGRTQVK